MMDAREKNRELLSAVEGGDVDRFAKLIGGDEALLHTLTPFGSWLHVAAGAGQQKMVEYLVRRGLDPNSRGGTLGGNALNVAASRGHEEMVSYLRSIGAEIDTSEPERNPMFSAIYGGHLGVVSLLLDMGIDVHVSYSGESMKNMDALAFARERGMQAIVDVLVQDSR